MNGQDRRVPSAPGASGKYILLGLGTFLVVGYLFVQLASFLATGHTTPGSPFTLIPETLMGLAKGTIPWTDDHTMAAVLPVALLLAVAVLLVLWKIRHPRKKGIEAAAQVLGKGNSMTMKAVEKKTIDGRLTTGETKGILLVNTMEKGQPRYVNFRQTGIVEMGPEAGKTTGFVIPMIMDGPGVVVATSNKRDLPDAICGARRDKGRVWKFDPQQITSRATPSWWLNFNEYVTDEIRAHKLAKIWMDASGPANAKRDAYFDSAGPNLLAGLLLACAVADKPLSQVFLWLMNDTVHRPVKILEDAGYLLPAAALDAVYHAPEEQRGGVFGTAAEMVSFLNNSRVRSWVEQGTGLEKRDQFSPEAFVRSGSETLISLSKEGIGSTGPLTAALVAWVLEAAEDYADTKPHGRLPVPLMVIGDEVANVCRLKDLPDLYSHYGSRGICFWAFIQNWSQGKRVWGPEGMQQLWDAANIRIVGAGQADDAHLKSISNLTGNQLITEYSANTSSGSGMRGNYSRNVSQRERAVLEVDDLHALQPGECLVMIAGDRPFLGRTIPWFKREEMKDIVAASISEFEPA